MFALGLALGVRVHHFGSPDTDSGDQPSVTVRPVQPTTVANLPMTEVVMTVGGVTKVAMKDVDVVAEAAVAEELDVGIDNNVASPSMYFPGSHAQQMLIKFTAST